MRIRINNRAARPFGIWLLAIIAFAEPASAGGAPIMGPPYARTPISETQSVIYVYRPFRSTLQVAETVVRCGDDRAHLHDGAYHRFTLAPGSVRCVADESPTSHSLSTKLAAIEINAEAGREYYVREDLHFGWWTGDLSLTNVDFHTAQDEIAGCKRH
jgi:hypothetical protein